MQYADGTPATPLDFVKLNLFARLWAKLGWPIEELDRALQAFFPTTLPAWGSAGFGAAFSAAWQKMFSPIPAIGFLAQANRLESQLAGAANAATTRALIFNARLDAAVCGVLLVLVAAILVDSLRVWTGILRGTREARVSEAPFVLSQLRAEEL